MMSAVGRKKRPAANTHKLMDEVPLCAAAAIQRGPRTAAILKSSTSQRPISRRSWDLGVVVSANVSSRKLLQHSKARGRERDLEFAAYFRNRRASRPTPPLAS